MAVETIDAVAGKLNIVIEQGATFEVPLIWKDETGSEVAGLSAWDARMQVRSPLSSPEILLELTVDNGGIIMGLNPGEIKLFISDADTAAIDWLAGVYNLEVISPSGSVTRLLKGNVKIDLEVTR